MSLFIMLLNLDYLQEEDSKEESSDPAPTEEET